MDEVRSALAVGDSFYTMSPSTGEGAAVHPDTCSVAGSTVKTIRSPTDAVKDNNLDNLQSCVWI